MQDIQNLATSGRFGKRFNVVRPFENLTMGEIQTELRLRGCIDVDMPKAQLVAKLKSILEGVQRVPSLLLSCPTSELKQFNLQRYSILPCEPLHDLKGHLNNLLSNVPTLLTGELKTNVHDLIQKCVYWKDSGRTGADMRVGLLRVYSMLLNTVECGKFSSNSNVLNLIQTAVTISHILYPHQVNVHLGMFLDCTTCVGYTMNCACLFSPLSLGQNFLDCIIIPY